MTGSPGAGGEGAPGWPAGAALAGSALQLAGVYWDLGWHHAHPGLREGFWSPPHTAIYAGVALALLAAVLGLSRQGGIAEEGHVALPPGPLRLALLGPAIQILAAPFDELWHRLFGQDVSVWSPPHLAGITGGWVGILGWIRHLVPAAGVRAKTARRFLLLGFASLLLAGCLVALGEYDHDQATRGPWLYPILTGALAPWVLVAARDWLGGGRGAAILDAGGARRGAAAAGVAFAIAWPITDFPLTFLLGARSWTGVEWVGSLVGASAAGWASARLGEGIRGAHRRRPPLHRGGGGMGPPGPLGGPNLRTAGRVSWRGAAPRARRPGGRGGRLDFSGPTR